MLDQLPTELAVQILQTAATELRFTNRQSVVNLALASNSVYSVVAPILYHTLIVTAKTRDIIAAFTRDEATQAAAKRVCSHVRILLDETDSERSLNPNLLLKVVNIIAAAHFVRDVAEAQYQMTAMPTIGPPLREITISSVDLRESINFIPQHSLQLITHVIGFLPIFRHNEDWEMFFSTSDLPAHGPERWTRSIIDVLPALTHFGFILAAMSYTTFNFEGLRKALETVVSYPRLKKVVLKVCGRYVEQHREEIEAVLDQIPDPRLNIVWEERPFMSWKEYDERRREDVVVGRSIWTQAVPVIHLAAP